MLGSSVFNVLLLAWLVEGMDMLVGGLLLVDLFEFPCQMLPAVHLVELQSIQSNHRKHLRLPLCSLRLASCGSY